MPNLEELLLPNNLLEWLPKELAGLKFLRRLDVSRNPLTSPPVEVAARGLDSVKRYFRDVESQSRRDDSGGGSAEERHVEVPNQVKVIFIGHSEAGKSQVIKGLLSTKAAFPQPRDTSNISSSGAGGGVSGGGVSGGGAITRSFSTPNYTSSGGGGGGSSSSSSSRNRTPAPSTTPVFPSTTASTPGAPHQKNRRHGAPPRTPPPPPAPPSTQDDEGWQVVGTARQRSLPAPSTPPPNRSQGRSETPASSYGGGTPGGPGASVGGGGRRWETVVAQGGGALGTGQGSGAGGARVESPEVRKVRRDEASRAGVLCLFLCADGKGRGDTGL